MKKLISKLLAMFTKTDAKPYEDIHARLDQLIEANKILANEIWNSAIDLEHGSNLNDWLKQTRSKRLVAYLNEDKYVQTLFEVVGISNSELTKQCVKRSNELTKAMNTITNAIQLACIKGK